MKTAPEKIYTVTGEPTAVFSDITEFKKKNKVVREYLSMQILMLPGKVNTGKIQPLDNQQQQVQLMPTKIVNAILIYQE